MRSINLKGNHGAIIDGPLLILNEPINDSRGYLFETWSSALFNQLVVDKINVNRELESCSKKNVLRGLHYQKKPFSIGKLVRCISGSIYDVVVDVRSKSPTFGHWAGIELNFFNKNSLWIPPGFAHGFLSKSENSILLYKVDEIWSPESEISILWNDETLNIKWPETSHDYCISEKDRQGRKFIDLKMDELL